MKYKIYLFPFFIFFLFLSLFLWDYIYLGVYPHENFLRFYLFIIFSLLPSYIYLFKYKLIDYELPQILYLEFFKQKSDLTINFIYLFFLFLIFLNFLSFQPKDFFSLDVYHDGFKLTPSMNYSLSNKLWSGSFIESGFFPNFQPLLAFLFIDKISIGSIYFIKYSIIFLNKIILVSISFLVVKELKFSKKNKIIFFILFSIFLLNLITKPGISYFPERYLLYLLFILLIFLNFLPNNYFSLILSSLAIGSVSFISIFWWMDIFIFTNFLLSIYCIFLFLRKEKNKLKYIFIGYFLILILSFLNLPKNEVMDFLKNTYYIVAKANTYNSFSYPSPLFGGDGRATKTLVFFSYSGLLLMLIVLNKKFLISNLLKLFLIFLFLASLVSFLFGLGRSDSYHIVNSTGLLMFNLIFYHLFLIFNFLNNKIIFKKSSFLLCLILLLTLFFFKEINLKKINNVFLVKENISNLLLENDDKFLNGKNLNYLNLIIYYEKLLDEGECVQVFSDETIIPYLLKRKTCTKYFFYQTLVGEDIQADFINELKNNMPRFILYKSDLFPFFEFFKRLKIVDDFIAKNYIFYDTFEYWTFYKLK
jgi:hypothetical protein